MNAFSAALGGYLTIGGIWALCMYVGVKKVQKIIRNNPDDHDARSAWAQSRHSLDGVPGGLNSILILLVILWPLVILALLGRKR